MWAWRFLFWEFLNELIQFNSSAIKFILISAIKIIILYYVSCGRLCFSRIWSILLKAQIYEYKVDSNIPLSSFLMSIRCLVISPASFLIPGICVFSLFSLSTFEICQFLNLFFQIKKSWDIGKKERIWKW